MALRPRVRWGTTWTSWHSEDTMLARLIAGYHIRDNLVVSVPRGGSSRVFLRPPADTGRPAGCDSCPHMVTGHGGIAQSQGFDWSALDARERPSCNS